jgi:hypothetical protein
MNYLLIFFFTMNIINSSIIHYNNYNVFKNSYLRLIVFKKKIFVKLYKNCYKCYNINFETLNQIMYKYNSLSEDDKTILETILSLCI